MEALKATRERSGDAPQETPAPVAGRDPAGKFTAKAAPSANGEEPKPGESIEPKPEEQPSEPPPAHLAADVKAVWSKLPEDARQIIAEQALIDRAVAEEFDVHAVGGRLLRRFDLYPLAEQSRHAAHQHVCERDLNKHCSDAG